MMYIAQRKVHPYHRHGPAAQRLLGGGHALDGHLQIVFTVKPSRL